VTLLKQTSPLTEKQCLPVLAGAASSTKIEGFLHIARLPPAQAKPARRRCHKTARSKGRTPSKTTRTGFVFEDKVFLEKKLYPRKLFTTLSEQILSSKLIFELYRCRWQVEIAIKRFKSLLNLDDLRAKEGSALTEVWLHGKLLYALMLEKHLRRQLGDKWGYLDRERQGTWWRAWNFLKHQITPIITGVAFWQGWSDCLSVLFERPRRRKLQTLPERVRKVLQIYPGLPVPIPSETQKYDVE